MLSGDTKATGVGKCVFTVTLKEGHAWSDRSTDPIMVTWSIEESYNILFLWLILVDMAIASAIMPFRMR